MQTPLHFPPERNNDPDYKWNEWDLRREAMKLARSSGKKKAKAVQTAVSAGARNAGNQVRQSRRHCSRHIFLFQPFGVNMARSLCSTNHLVLVFPKDSRICNKGLSKMLKSC